MSAASTGSGSHFAPRGDGRSWDDDQLDHGSSAPLTGGSASSSLPMSTLNGSHATRPDSYEPARSSSAGDTAEFLALASQCQTTGSSSQSHLDVDARPAGAPAHAAPTPQVPPTTQGYGTADYPEDYTMVSSSPLVQPYTASPAAGVGSAGRGVSPSDTIATLQPFSPLEPTPVQGMRSQYEGARYAAPAYGSSPVASAPLYTPTSAANPPQSAYTPHAAPSPAPMAAPTPMATPASMAARQVSPASYQAAAATPAAAPQAGVPRQMGASQQAGPSVPANPLVAARAAAGSSAQPRAAAAPGVKQPGDLYPIQEVETEQAQRPFDTTFGGKSHTGRTVAIVIGVVVVLALAVLGVLYMLRQQSVNEVRDTVNSAIDRLRDTDGLIVPLDEAIASELDSSTASEGLSNLMLQSSSTNTALSDAESLIMDAEESSELLGEDDLDAIAAVKESIAARRSMIEIGRMLLSADDTTSRALENLEQAYSYIAEANAQMQISHDVSTSFNETYAAGGDTSGIDLWSVVTADNNAVTAITSAQASVAAAKEALPELDLSVLETYLNAYLETVNLAVQLDTCMANWDFNGANALVEQYNQADANQAAAAQQIPADPSELLAGSYSSETESQRAAFEEAREECVAADAVINAYLGYTASSDEVGISGESATPAEESDGDETQGQQTPSVGENAAADAGAAADGTAEGDPAAAGDAAAGDAAATGDQAAGDQATGDQAVAA